MNVLITGSTSGLGLKIKEDLANNKKIKKIICIGRNHIGTKLSNAGFKKKIIKIKCDLSEKKNIDNILEKINFIKKIDVLINNAGVILFNKQKNSLKINKLLFINFIAPVYLIKILKKKILNSKKKLVINIVSHANDVNIDNEQIYNFSDCSLNPWLDYKKSKFYLIVYTFLLKQFSQKLNCICINPGRISTSFGKDNLFIGKIIYLYNFFFGINPKKISKKIVNIILNKKKYKKTYYNFYNNKQFSYNFKKKKIIIKILKKLSVILKSNIYNLN